MKTITYFTAFQLRSFLLKEPVMCLIVSVYLKLKIKYEMEVIYFFHDKNPIETILLPRNTGFICFNWSNDKIV